MKYYLILLIFLLVVSCSTNLKNHEGYIYDYNTLKPINNLTICLERHKTKNNCVYTDKMGFFKFIKNDLNNHIYIYENDNLIDSIQCIRTQGGERLQYCFVDTKKDTAFVDMKIKKIIKQ